MDYEKNLQKKLHKRAIDFITKLVLSDDVPKDIKTDGLGVLLREAAESIQITSEISISHDDYIEIKILLREDHKVPAVKLLREITGLELITSKQIVDGIQIDMNLNKSEG